MKAFTQISYFIHLTDSFQWIAYIYLPIFLLVCQISLELLFIYFRYSFVICFVDVSLNLAFVFIVFYIVKEFTTFFFCFPFFLIYYFS